MITIFFKCPSFFVITATTTQNANSKKIKNRKQSIDAHYIYRPASEQRFYLVFIIPPPQNVGRAILDSLCRTMVGVWIAYSDSSSFWYYLHTFTLREQSSKFDRVCFYHVNPEWCLIIYCRQLKYMLYLLYCSGVHVENNLQKRNRMSSK